MKYPAYAPDRVTVKPMANAVANTNEDFLIWLEEWNTYTSRPADMAEITAFNILVLIRNEPLPAKAISYTRRYSQLLKAATWGGAFKPWCKAEIRAAYWYSSANTIGPPKGKTRMRISINEMRTAASGQISDKDLLGADCCDIRQFPFA